MLILCVSRLSLGTSFPLVWLESRVCSLALLNHMISVTVAAEYLTESCLYFYFLNLFLFLNLFYFFRLHHVPVCSRRPKFAKFCLHIPSEICSVEFELTNVILYLLLLVQLVASCTCGVV
ncbi:hypothetical protein M758_3G222100 [Ceratodon purpureus]|nr:hypothetical protein M758_3G222100 [Ceratodon purpureus]